MLRPNSVRTVSNEALGTELAQRGESCVLAGGLSLAKTELGVHSRGTQRGDLYAFPCRPSGWSEGRPLAGTQMNLSHV